QAQSQFEAERDSLGQKVLADLKKSGKKGVVIFSRAYMSQDSGANLGIAEKLAQLGVVPIPIDFLPLKSINPKDFSDRPYWSYEAKFIAAAHIVAQDPQLFGLVLTNFGCGPNSFMLGLVEDIMGTKPLGQVEIDEHAAEAGIVTRLEAFVDTIQGFAKPENEIQSEKPHVRNSGFFKRSGKTFVIPRMSPHVDALSASMNAFGVQTLVLPEPDERNILYSNQVTTGAECLPFRVTLGDFVRFCRENGNLNQYEGLMAGAYGPCRLGKYAGEHNRALQELGFSLPVRASVSNNAYRDLDIGAGFPRFVLINVVAVDVLQRLLWRTRPYEKQPGQADELFKETMEKMCARISRRESLNGFLSAATHDFQSIVDSTLPRRPLVGINGEIYLRTNNFSNSDLVRACENAGLEAMVAPVGEWIRYVTHRYLEDAIKERHFKKVVNRYINKTVVEHDGRALMQQCIRLLGNHDDPIDKVIGRSGHYLSPRCGGEAILSIGAGLEWMERPQFAGAISVMPHGCMPGGIVASMAEKFSAMHGKPWISLTYDGFAETNNSAKITEFAELIRFRSN
ncbi:MAG TPA: acyl-CoA dehydratase activase-related protein, partial [Dehalococcoidales bacterium]|nr:acyl-CoA dehydratase activase-related protein [Dehalococcoidales bacterium]